MYCFRQKRTRPPFNSGWTLLLRINCIYDKCIIWNTVTKYGIVWRFFMRKWKQIKYLTTSLSTFSVLSMLFIESYLLPQFMYDCFLLHINQYSKLYNHKHTKHHYEIDNVPNRCALLCHGIWIETIHLYQNVISCMY